MKVKLLDSYRIEVERDINFPLIKSQSNGFYFECIRAIFENGTFIEIICDYDQNTPYTSYTVTRKNINIKRDLLGLDKGYEVPRSDFDALLKKACLFVERQALDASC